MFIWAKFRCWLQKPQASIWKPTFACCHLVNLWHWIEGLCALAFLCSSRFFFFFGISIWHFIAYLCVKQIVEALFSLSPSLCPSIINVFVCYSRHSSLIQASKFIIVLNFPHCTWSIILPDCSSKLEPKTPYLSSIIWYEMIESKTKFEV